MGHSYSPVTDTEIMFALLEGSREICPSELIMIKWNQSQSALTPSKENQFSVWVFFFASFWPHIHANATLCFVSMVLVSFLTVAPCIIYMKILPL